MTYNLKFCIVYNKETIPILGIDTCIILKLVSRIGICQLFLSKNILEKELNNIFKYIFEGVGNFKENSNVKLKSKTKPYMLLGNLQ